MNEWTTPIGQVRLVGMMEGVSFLLLLGVAMPLKYLAGIAIAVKIVGWFHGLLFMVLCVVLTRALIGGGIRLSQAALVFVAALLPFGPFLIDRRLRDDQSAVRHRP
jgi:integral membrane protein